MRRGSPARAAAVLLLTTPLLGWSLLAVLLGGGGPGGPGVVRGLLALALTAAVLWAWRRGLGAVLAATALSFGATLTWFRSLEPSHERSWTEDQSRVARAIVDGSMVTLRNVRRFRYRSEDAWEPGWSDLVVDLAELEGVDFVLTRFDESPDLGHTMVTFRFTEDRFVVVSIEVRKEEGETYGLLRGLFRQFELAYVVGDERDLVRLRTNERGNDVWIHPCTGPRERQVAYFLDVCDGIERIAREPAFYDTLWNNCTTVLVAHWERVTGTRLGFDRRILLPGRTDALAAELGLIDGAVGADRTSPAYVSERARALPDDDDFSVRLRAGAAARR